MMPFSGGIEATANAALLLSIAAAVLTLFQAEREPSLRRSAVKTLAVALLAVISSVEHGPLLLTGALVLSAAGDAFLSRIGERAFLAGLGSFLAAHVLYILLFAMSGGGAGMLFSDLWRPVLAVAMVLLAAAMATLLLPRVEHALKMPIAVYVAAILAMGLAALTTQSLAVIAGAILFMVSDGILATERFLTAGTSPVRLPMRYAVWITYYAAQLLIALGILLG
ncbi:lysoplasmalogenase [Mesorhizobium sp. L-8-10]|uniref:lysoplasmalogenase n=1 Tax=Mesorhizobium sp. L-8-10 TaxID=2744523 RepID=UPI001929701A|nr:lysoplasmalogenase [Mesorhizobium sp. L-8-10]BCH29630.1 lysoplasmalogenase [Mesorhizobium sp. L-8-10]